MENTEIMTVEQTGQLSTNVFSDPEAFQNLFNIGKMFASSSLVPQAYQGKPMVPCPDREKCGAYKCPPLPDGTPR